MQEASRLLRTSIIEVETSNVVLGGGWGGENVPAHVEDDPDNMDVEEDEQAQKGGETVSPTAAQEEPADADAVKKEKQQAVSFERYQQVSHMVVAHLRNTDIMEEGTKQSDIVGWVIAQQDYNSEKEMVQEARLVSRIVDRLVAHDHVLMEVDDGEEGQRRARRRKADRLLIVHPNHDPLQ